MRILFVLIGLLSASAFAQSPVPVPVPSANAANHSDWATILAAAAERQQLGLRPQADAERSAAERRRAEGWLAGAPMLDGLYREDRPLSNQGAGERQFGLRLPLRRPGQSEAWTQLAEQTALDARSRQQAAELALLGLLRNLAWDVRLADARVQAAQIRYRQLTQLLTAMRRQVALGEAAAIDAQLLESRALDAEVALAAEQTSAEAARARWQAATGQTNLPVDLGQTAIPAALSQLNDANALIRQQPLLAHLADQAQLAGAVLNASRAEGAGAPELGVAIKRDRSDRQTPWDNSLQLSLSLPIGGEVYRAPQLAELNQQKSAAQVSLIQATQSLWGDILDLRTRTAAWPARLRLLDQRVTLAETVLAKQQKARTLGEIDWATWLIYEREAADARLQAQEAHQQAARDASLLKQAYGLMPSAPIVPGVHP